MPLTLCHKGQHFLLAQKLRKGSVLCPGLVHIWWQKLERLLDDYVSDNYSLVCGELNPKLHILPIRLSGTHDSNAQESHLAEESLCQNMDI